MLDRALAAITLLAMSLLTGLFCCSTAGAQSGLTALIGKFTLTHEVRWGKGVLRPGNYTITIESAGLPIIARVSKTDGIAVALVTTIACSDRTGGVNALLVKQSNGQLVVHSLALAKMGMLLIYDPSLAREGQEARRNQAVPILWVKK